MPIFESKNKFLSVYLLSHPTIVARLLLAMFLIFLLFRMSWRVIVIVLNVTGEVPHCKNFTTVYTYKYAHTTHTCKIHPCRACTHAHVHAHTYVHIRTRVLARPFPKGTVPFGGSNVPFGSAQKPIMCPLVPPQNQHIFNSHLNYLNLKTVWALNIGLSEH